jgi:hypothetical protein
MFALARILLTTAVCTVALSAIAQVPAPTTTAFDGKYVGVSRESSKAGSNPGAKCPPSGVPAPFTIRNGMIGRSGGQGWQGAVSPQGGLTMRNANSLRIDGQIDPQGTITAKYSGPACITTFIWHKQAG